MPIFSSIFGGTAKLILCCFQLNYILTQASNHCFLTTVDIGAAILSLAIWWEFFSACFQSRTFAPSVWEVYNASRFKATLWWNWKELPHVYKCFSPSLINVCTWQARQALHEAEFISFISGAGKDWENSQFPKISSYLGHDSTFSGAGYSKKLKN